MLKRVVNFYIHITDLSTASLLFKGIICEQILPVLSLRFLTDFSTASLLIHGVRIFIIFERVVFFYDPPRVVNFYDPLGHFPHTYNITRVVKTYHPFGQIVDTYNISWVLNLTTLAILRQLTPPKIQIPIFLLYPINPCRPLQ